jgi:hypothetical protein
MNIGMADQMITFIVDNKSTELLGATHYFNNFGCTIETLPCFLRISTLS